MDHSVEQTVKTLLSVARISPSTEELAELTGAYPAFRSALDRLHEVDDARYEAPALGFQAIPPGVAWGFSAGRPNLVVVVGEDPVR